MTLVSVVIPARDAAETLAETIASLQAQTHRDWEAIVLDDGSRDATRVLAEGFAAADPRIRVLDGPCAGVSAARNLGLEQARGEYVLFLDADDLIMPTHLERLGAVLDRSPETVAVHCGWARLGLDGVPTVVVQAALTGDLFPQFVHSCVFPIHACLARLDAVRAVGGFDRTLVTCEDWDLWLRITRFGRPFAADTTTLSHYRMRPRSASQDGVRMLADGLVVLERARQRDPRVPAGVVHEDGWPDHDLAENAFHHLSWTAGLVIGSNGDPAPLLEALEGLRSPFVSPEIVAGCLHVAIPLPTCRSPHEWPTILAELGAEIDAFLERLEQAAGVRMLARRTRIALEELIAADVEELAVGRTIGTTIEVTEPVADAEAPAGVSRLACVVQLEGDPLGTIVLPVADGRVPADVIEDAVSARYAWPILTRFFERRDVATSTTADVELWAMFLRDVFGLPEWEPERFYVLQPPRAEIGDERSETAAIEAVDELPTLAGGAGRSVVLTVGGAPLGLVELGPGPWPPEALVPAIVESASFELARAAVRRAILGRPLEGGGDLRARLRDAAARPGRTADDELTLGRRHPNWIGGPATRAAVLPPAASDDLVETARVLGEPVGGNGGRPVRYRPEAALVPAAAAQRRGLSRLVGARLERATNFARRARTRPAPETLSRQVPVLMYHRIGTGDDGPLARYCLDPGRFEEQLVALRDSGYRSLPLTELREVLRARRPIPGRPVVLTFDDGTVDFASTAWPLLVRHGFGAVLFVVSDLVGETNVWDTGYGSIVRLLDWQTLARLAREGVEIGAHSATHPFLTALENAEIVTEASRARRAIFERVGVDPLAFAYPYGDVDDVVAHLVGAAGFELGLTTEGRPTELGDEPLRIPRLEVHSEMTPDLLLGLLAAGEPAQPV